MRDNLRPGPRIVSGGSDPLRLKPEPWTQSALCGQTDPEEFFPEKGGSTRQAKSICRGCEVSAQCLEYALKHGERFGIWGGMSERERRRLASGILGEEAS